MVRIDVIWKRDIAGLSALAPDAEALDPALREAPAETSPVVPAVSPITRPRTSTRCPT